MPTLDENRQAWNTDAGWGDADAGSKWSQWWGGAEAQWRFSLLPRAGAFLPAPTILEIAPGYGRWTHFLKDLCAQLIVVDLSERCIAACRQRFAAESHISYIANDGRSLAAVPDGAVDFVFSFDSLVHADATVIGEYVSQLARKLTRNGVCFLHHSNWGAYPRYATGLDLIPTRFMKKALARLRIIEGEAHWRARDMTAERFEMLVRAAGLQCIGQERINWRVKRLTDCISVFTHPTSRWARPNIVVDNPRFSSEAEHIRRIAPCYLRPGSDTGGAGDKYSSNDRAAG